MRCENPNNGAIKLVGPLSCKVFFVRAVREEEGRKGGRGREGTAFPRCFDF